MWKYKHPNWYLHRITSNLYFISLPLIMNHDYESLFINIAQCAIAHCTHTSNTKSYVCSHLPFSSIAMKKCPSSFQCSRITPGFQIPKPVTFQKPYQQAPLSVVPSTFKLLSPSFKDDLVSLTWNSGENTSSFSYCPLSSRTLYGQEYQRKTFGLSFLNSHTLHSAPSGISPH